MAKEKFTRETVGKHTPPYLIPDALWGDCFHGEVWVRCPYCRSGMEMMGAHPILFIGKMKYPVYECPRCKGVFKDY